LGLEPDGFSQESAAAPEPKVGFRDALKLSLEAAFAATGAALVLGSMAAFVLGRFRFFGQSAISFLFVLPIALPGIITGIALNSFFSFNGVSLSLWTIVVGHTTFCIVIVYNNLIARLQRTPRSLGEASMDLGARGWFFRGASSIRRKNTSAPSDWKRILPLVWLALVPLFTTLPLRILNAANSVVVPWRL